MKKTIVAALAAALMSSGAYAADVYSKGSTKDGGDVFAAPGVVNWTGFYVGGRFGGSFGNMELDFEELGRDGYESTGNIDGLAMTGLNGGGQLGFDVARGRFLFGIFGGYDWSNSEVSITGVDLNPSGSWDSLNLGRNDTYSIAKDNEWSVGGRVGYLAAPRTLVYVLAAYTQADFTASRTGFDDTEETIEGITVGGGVELALGGNVFVGLEATHTFFDEHSEAEDFGVGSDRVTLNLDETKVMGTLKLKLNSGLPSLTD
jgi:outer membrane immunogenic protein